jgi:predicted DNA-binding transcriptional regulator AlpA
MSRPTDKPTPEAAPSPEAPELPPLPEGVAELADNLTAAMDRIFGRLAALELSAAGIEPTVTIDQWAAALACSRREVERMRSAGKLPPPDLTIGRSPRWKAETLRAWIDAQRPARGRRGRA